MSEPSHLEIIPLGGLGEFGMNLMVYRWGSECLVVDAGMMFPGEQHLGVDVVIPDLSFLDDCGTIHAVVLTHAHEDHIGALPYLLARHDVPVLAAPYTEGLVRRRLAEHEQLATPAFRRLGDAPISLGPFGIETVRVAHSVPQSRMLVLRTPVGLVVHTADFKLDSAASDFERTDIARLRALGDEGVLLLLSDSTNADRPGTTPSESLVAGTLDRVISGCRGRVVVTTFSSHIERLQGLVAAASRHGRRTAFVGRSLVSHADVAEQLGLLRIPGPARLAPESVMDEPPARVLVVASGSQGEPLSAMARIAVGRHRNLTLDQGDLLIHAAREIPGNEKHIRRMINHALRRGADVITAAQEPVHVSGHAAQEELRLLIQLLRPRCFVPIHGEYRQLQAHARLAADSGIDRAAVQLADSGDVIAVGSRGIEIVDHVHVGQVYIDATMDEVDWTVVRDRRRIADGGIVVPVVAVHRETGVVNGLPEIVARGFVPIAGEASAALLQEARRVVAESLAEATPEERADEGLLRARIQTELRRFLKQRTQRTPLVIPVIVEL